MKKIFFVTCALFSISAASVSAQCCEPVCGCGDFYFGAFGGANWVNHNGSHSSHNKYKAGYLVGGDLGYRFDNGFRIEGEISYRQNDRKNNGHKSKKTTVYMGNAIYQFDVDCLCGLDLFFGAGLGYANTQHHHHNGREGHNNKHNGFAWQLIAGVAYPICENFELDLEYRFLDETKSKFNNNSVDVGVRYYF
jgi:opacity protein-like surface antigen